MSVKEARERMDKMSRDAEKKAKIEELKSQASMDAEILKELKKINNKVEQIRFNVNSIAVWYVYIGLFIAGIVLLVNLMT